MSYLDEGYDTHLRKQVTQVDSSFAGDAYSIDGAIEGGISGNKIRGGIIQTADGKSRIDLTAKQIVINDGTNDRVLIGYQENGF